MLVFVEEWPMTVKREHDWYLISLTSALLVIMAAIALGVWYVTR